MDLNDIPYGTGSSSDKPPRKKKKKDEESSGSSLDIAGSLLEDDGLYPDPLDEDDDEERDPLEDDDELEETQSFFKSPKFLAIAGGAVLVLAVIVYFVFIKKGEEPAPVTEETPQETADPAQQKLADLYNMGIGKDGLAEDRIFEQGNIESDDFRKGFTNTDAPENYVLPIDITYVNDSVSYKKHRTVTDDGIDVYWVDAVYKSKKTVFTIPYYIYQTLASEGVMDVVVEVITDDEDNVFVGSITALPPSEGE